MSEEQLPSITELLQDELLDLYSAEIQLLETLSELSKATRCHRLNAIWDTELQETEIRKNRLEQIGQLLLCDMKGRLCLPMKQRLEEANEVIKGSLQAQETAFTAILQEIAHYTIAGYCTAYHFAEILGYPEVSQLLSETIQEVLQIDASGQDINKGNIRSEMLYV